MESQVPCPRCKKSNRRGAKFCSSCGEPLLLGGPINQAAKSPDYLNTPQAPIPSPDKELHGIEPSSVSMKTSHQTGENTGQNLQNISDIGGAINRKLDDVDNSIDRWLTRVFNKIIGESTSKENQSRPKVRKEYPSDSITVKSPQTIPPADLYAIIQNYRILQVKPLNHTNYYIVQPTRCINGHKNKSVTAQKCAVCQIPMLPQIMHETRAIHQVNPREIIDLSSDLPATIKCESIFVQKENRYTLVNLPLGAWQPLLLTKPSIEQAISWTYQLGTALEKMNAKGWIFFDRKCIPDLLNPIIVVNNQNAFFVDLSSSQKYRVNNLSDMMYLANVLYRLTTGDEQFMSELSNWDNVPLSIQKILNKAQANEYSSVSAFIADLKQPKVESDTFRSLRQNAGYLTDKGILRDHNEDQVGKYSLGMDQTADTVEVGLYLIADGMGGHQAGEQASKDVARIILEQVHTNLSGLQNVPKLQRRTINLAELVTPGEVLRTAILHGNELLFKTRLAVRSDRGTTLTAALVIGDQCTIANVGDSRTYLYRDGNLRQITQDHSLVVQLVNAGMIKPEEVRTHPNRNQIYRTLGDKLNLEVDIFSETLIARDRLLLCSDGLWEMVLDAEILRILSQAPTPQTACDMLIKAANNHGGEDNISAIVVELE